MASGKSSMRISPLSLNSNNNRRMFPGGMPGLSRSPTWLSDLRCPPVRNLTPKSFFFSPQFFRDYFLSVLWICIGSKIIKELIINNFSCPSKTTKIPILEWRFSADFGSSMKMLRPCLLHFLLYVTPSALRFIFASTFNLQIFWVFFYCYFIWTANLTQFTITFLHASRLLLNHHQPTTATSTEVNFKGQTVII